MRRIQPLHKRRPVARIYLLLQRASWLTRSLCSRLTRSNQYSQHHDNAAHPIARHVCTLAHTPLLWHLTATPWQSPVPAERACCAETAPSTHYHPTSLPRTLATSCSSLFRRAV